MGAKFSSFSESGSIARGSLQQLVAGFETSFLSSLSLGKGDKGRATEQAQAASC